MKDKLNFISNWLEVKSPTYKTLNKDMKDLPLWYKLTSAVTTGVLVGCTANGGVSPTTSSEQTNSNGNTQEFTPTPESDLYPTTFAWLDGRSVVIQKVMAEYELSSNDIKGFEITVSGLLSATDVREEKVQFINFIDPNTGLNLSLYYDSKNPNGLLNDFETVNRGGGLFVERQFIDLNDPDNYHALLIIPVDAEEKLKSGESTVVEFNPPEWIRAYMPALDPSKNLVVNVPIIPELTTTASIGFIPEFLVTDGTVEGVQSPTPVESQESQLAPETQAKMKEWQERLGENYEVRTDGTIWDKKNGLQLPGINWEKGTWTYEFDGNPDFTIPVTARSLWPQKDVNGNITGIIEFVHLGWMWDGEKMVREEFQGEPVFSKFESDAFLANPSNVDLTHRSLDLHSTVPDPLLVTYLERGKNFPQIVIRDLKVSVKRYGLPENIIPFPDGQGGWRVVETTTFMMSEMVANPYTIMRYRSHDGTVKIMIIDRDDIVPEGKPSHPEWKNPVGLSEYYKDHPVNLQY